MVSRESLETLTADYFYGGLLERGAMPGVPVSWVPISDRSDWSDESDESDT